MATSQQPNSQTNQQPSQESKQGSNSGVGQGAAQQNSSQSGAANGSATDTQVPIGGDRGQSRNTADQTNRATSQHQSGQEHTGQQHAGQQQHIGQQQYSGQQQYGGQNVHNQRTASPFTLMRALTEEMDRLFEGFAFVPPLVDPLFGITGGYSPRSIGSGAQRNVTSGGTSRSPAPRSQSNQSLSQRGTFFPEIEVLQRGDNLVVRADLPGMKKEDIRVECEDGALRLSGHRKEESSDESEGYFHSERSYGSFTRVIPLPKDIDQAALKAKFEHGVLEVTVPLPKEKNKSRQVEIQ